MPIYPTSRLADARLAAALAENAMRLDECRAPGARPGWVQRWIDDLDAAERGRAVGNGAGGNLRKKRQESEKEADGDLAPGVVEAPGATFEVAS